MNSQSLPQFFVFAKRKNAQAQNATLYLKISLEKESYEKSLGIKCLYRNWDSQAMVINGDPVSTRQTVVELEKEKQKFMGAYYLLKQEETYFTLQDVLEVSQGNRKPGALSFCQCFNDLISRMEKSKGIEGASETNIQKHKRALVHFQGFGKSFFKSSDLSFQKINRNTINDLVDYLKTEGECSHNTAMKYLQIIKKVYRIGMDNGWVKVNAFGNFKFKMKTVDRDFLNDAELKRIQEKEFDILRLDVVRDLFVFSCFTGLAYIDVKNLKKRNITQSKQGFWIKSRRTKTGVEASIPLLPPARKILDKHTPKWQELNSDKLLFTIITNQKMNAYLKEIAHLCKINKTITFHLARHTFATTVTLSNDIPIETVSKMLGHSRISMTQHYSKVVDLKIERDTYKLHDKFK